jgi:hypothetical protein
MKLFGEFLLRAEIAEFPEFGLRGKVRREGSDKRAFLVIGGDLVVLRDRLFVAAGDRAEKLRREFAREGQPMRLGLGRDRVVQILARLSIDHARREMAPVEQSL